MAVIGRRIIGIGAPDNWYLKRGLDAGRLADVAVGATVEAIRRHGKLLLVDLVDRPTIGLRFGMTGRLIIDGAAPIQRLEYSSGRQEPTWDRVMFSFDDGGEMKISDPRRLGGVEVGPDESRLGPDAASIGPAQLRRAVAGNVALKARLLDQRRIAGIGNLRCGVFAQRFVHRWPRSARGRRWPTVMSADCWRRSDRRSRSSRSAGARTPENCNCSGRAEEPVPAAAGRSLGHRWVGGRRSGVAIINGDAVETGLCLAPHGAGLQRSGS